MHANLENELIDEIRLLQTHIETQKRAIKHNLSKGKPVEEAQQHLKELNTRLGVLEGNLKKLRTQQPESAELPQAAGEA